MGTLYHSSDDDDLIGPSLEEMAEERERILALNKAERIANTYKMRIGACSFELYLQFSGHPKDGKIRFDMEAQMLPDEIIPADISRQSISEMLYDCGYHGHIHSIFEEQNGVFVASDAWIENFAWYCEKVRKRNIIKIDDEQYNFPIVGREALVNGQAFPVKRVRGYWILSV